MPLRGPGSSVTFSLMVRTFDDDVKGSGLILTWATLIYVLVPDNQQGTDLCHLKQITSSIKASVSLLVKCRSKFRADSGNENLNDAINTHS